MQTNNDSWIEGLALNEINMERTGVVDFDEVASSQELLTKHSVELIETLREEFDQILAKFNHYRGNADPHSHIKIFKISNTINDFMLFRNAMKLVITLKEPGTIGIVILTANNRIHHTKDRQKDDFETYEISIHQGPFGIINWTYMGEMIDVKSLAAHFASFFIRASAR